MKGLLERTKTKGGEAMEDSEITALLLRRDESAIEAIEETYGARLKNLALNTFL